MRLAMPRAEFGSGFSSVFPRILVVSPAKSRRLENINGQNRNRLRTEVPSIYFWPIFEGISPENLA